MSSRLLQRIGTGLRLAVVVALTGLLALGAVPPATIWGAPSERAAQSDMHAASEAQAQLLAPEHAPAIWIKTPTVNTISTALTEGTSDVTDDRADEFVHPIQQWGAFGNQAFATAAQALAWVNANIAYQDDMPNYGFAEAWANPEQTLLQGSGDTEDQVFLLASLLKYHTGDVNAAAGDVVYANCGVDVSLAGGFQCWVFWVDVATGTARQMDPVTGMQTYFPFPGAGTLWFNDTMVLGIIHEYYPVLWGPVGGYDRQDFGAIATNGFGAAMNNYPWAVAQFKGDLYVGTGRNVPDNVGKLITSVLGFLPPGLDVFGPITRATLPVGGQLWALDQRAEIWRRHEGAWQRVYQSQMVPQPVVGWTAKEQGFRQMAVFTDANGAEALYAAQGAVLPHTCSSSLIMRSFDGVTWLPVITPPAMGCDSRDLIVHDGRLYVATGFMGRAQVWSTDDPSGVVDNWTLVADFTNHDLGNTYTTSLASMDGFLYAGTQNFASGFQVFRSVARSPDVPSPGAWWPVIANGGGDGMNFWAGTMAVFKNNLYVGTMSWPVDPSLFAMVAPKGFELFRIAPDTTWELVIGDYFPRVPVPGMPFLRVPTSGWPGGFGNFLNLYAWSLEEKDGVLYLGSFDASTFLRQIPVAGLAGLITVTPAQLQQMVFGLKQIIAVLDQHGVAEPFVSPYRQLLAALSVGNPALVDWAGVLQIIYQGFAGGDLWKSEDGDWWEPVTLNGFDNPDNYGVRNLVGVNPLYAGMSNPYTGAEIWRAGAEPAPPPPAVGVTKVLQYPVGGLAAVGQELQYNITVVNQGPTPETFTLRDEYDFACMRSVRAEPQVSAHGGSQGFLQWDNLGPLAPGEAASVWVVFTAEKACGPSANKAIVQMGGETFEAEATVDIWPTIARVGGYIFHDDNGDGALVDACSGTDVTPAGCEPGIEGASAETTLPDSRVFRYDTNTSGWFSFNLLDHGNYHVDSMTPAGGWWTPTSGPSCDVEVVNNWDHVWCNQGYWWGLDGPPVAAAMSAQAEMTFTPSQDAFISGWEPGNHGGDLYLQTRQPGVASSLLQFDLDGLPAGATIVSAKLRLYSPFGSNTTNRLYMTAYPLDKPWVESEVSWTQAAAGVPWAAAGATTDHGPPIGWAWTDAPGWVEIDLDPASLGPHGLLIRGEGTENREVAYWYYSREYWHHPEWQPQLVVGHDAP